MMKLIRSFIVLILAVAAFSGASVDAQNFASSNSPRAVEDQVRRKILRLPRYEIFDAIGFQVNGDTVTLNGKVRNAVNKKDAERSVARIPGVNHVVNNIEILPLGSFDDSIRVQLYQTLAGSGGLSRYMWPNSPSVRLIVDGGHVSLEGYVSSRGDSNTMNILAHGISGVFSVTNNLIVDRERVR
ncbi:MAG TPA: BON domain-containing protein [Pyrinomonadaceae bacterium]|nr:BON domain-containing protein [Pyrinomonadaceae bacterium]